MKNNKYGGLLPILMGFLGLMAFLYFISYIFTNSNVKNNVVKAAYVPAGYYLPFLIVEKEGLLEKRGYSFQLTKLEKNTHMISNFINGKLDVTAQSAFTMFPVEERHPGNFKFIYGQNNQSYFFLTKNKKIRKLSDFRHKNLTIGTWTSPTAVAFIKILLQKEGLEFEKDYNIRQYGAYELASKLDNGTSEVIFAFDMPAVNLVENKGAHYIDKNIIKSLGGNDGKIFNGGGFIHSKLILNDPQKAQAIKEAFNEALHIINHKKELSSKILSNSLSLQKEMIFNNYDKLDSFYIPNKSTLEIEQSLIKLLLDNNLMNKKIDVKHMFLY